MSFVDQSAEALGQADDCDPAVRLREAAQQSFQEPSPECVPDILDTRHVEVDAREQCALRHGAVDEMFQVSGVLRRPRTDRRQPQAVALGQALKQGFASQSYAHEGAAAPVWSCGARPMRFTYRHSEHKCRYVEFFQMAAALHGLKNAAGSPMSVAGHCGTDCKAFRQYGEIADVGYWHLADFNSRLLLCLLGGNNGHRSCRGLGHSKLIKKTAFLNESPTLMECPRSRIGQGRRSVF